ncbi:MAG: hydrogen gas-evolving membrane-bound hydrogenase subunit E [Halolamina sp.]|uniref:hydrogen gas-evolving membrane-bound hydrogenase subunit E n=1 Tax=Halolamina sp. TaxID=1940283 RepID=UPI002FC2BA48
MQSTLLVLTLVGLPFAAAAVIPALYRVLGERTAYAAAAVAAVCLGIVAQLHAAGAHGVVSVEWIPSLGVSLSFYVDGLSLLIAYLATGVGTLILTYSGGYMHGEPGQAKYYATLLAFMGSMLGVALASDLVALFTFWELTSVSSFLLIGHYTGDDDSLYAARKSMLITVAGGLFMLVGFALLAWAGETFAIQELIGNSDAVIAKLRGAGLFVPTLLLLGVGAATKSAQVPFHVWLPNAMEAPTPVSAFLHSATMVKAGVYLVGRFRPFFLTGEQSGIPAWTFVFVALGLLTMTVTAILAVGATDIKELLAYSTASHLGLIVAGFGFAEAIGGEAGSFHILNHASFKAALFLVAGIIAHEAGTRKIKQLGGLRTELPITAAVATVASLSMAGVPPFNGFYSKELLFDAAWEFGAHYGGLTWLAPVIAVFGSVFTFLYSIRFLMLFWGEKTDHVAETHVHSPGLALLAPPALLGGIVAFISLDVAAGTHITTEFIANDAFASVLPGDPGHPELHAKLPDHVSPPVIMSALTILTGATLYPRYSQLHELINELTTGPIRANWWYDNGVTGLTAASIRGTPYLEPTLLRTYLVWSVAAIVSLALGGYLVAGVALPAFTGLGPGMAIRVAIVLLVAVLGAFAVGRAPSHIAGVLTLSILGFMVAIFFILADAPDLALTQLVVETLVLGLFLLVLDQLPAYYGESERAVAIRDGVLSALAGLTVTVTVLITTAAEPPSTMKEFFVARAGVPAEHGAVFTDYGGGGNIVNVILVDFRAFDTLGEISVVAMAALAVLTLVRMRDNGEMR